MTTFTAQELAALYQEVADGGEIEYRVTGSKVWMRAYVGPTLGSPKQWRIKPTKKIIDMSVLIDSQIDCEFQSSSSMSWAIGKLRHHVSCSKKPMYHIHRDSQGFTKCQPRMNHKHAWQGGDCPLPEGFMVNAWMRGAKTTESRLCTDLRWNHTGGLMDIMHFEVFPKLADGYVMPYEVSE
jgi:hypothetical protein